MLLQGSLGRIFAERYCLLPICAGQGGAKGQPGIGHQTVVIKGDLDAVGVVVRWHLLGAPGLGSVLYFQNHYPRSTEALSYPFSMPRHLSFRWIGDKEQAVGLLGRAYSVSLPTPTVFNGFKLRTGVAWD